LPNERIGPYRIESRARNVGDLTGEQSFLLFSWIGEFLLGWVATEGGTSPRRSGR
jgi:hypothetical protein